jgi:hypothetical protein
MFFIVAEIRRKITPSEHVIAVRESPLQDQQRGRGLEIVQAQYRPERKRMYTHRKVDPAYCG